MRRRQVIKLLGGAAAAWPLAAQAQQPGKIWRIGLLSGLARPPSFQSSYFGGFLEGMRELGYVDGPDFIVEWRFADGHYERFPDLAAELVRLNVDVIVVTASSAIRVVQHATSTIPIVMGYSIDPIGNGLVESLAHPGGNTTGLSSSQEDTIAKQIGLLVAAVPGITRMGVLVNPSNPSHSENLKTAEASGARARLTVVAVEARNQSEVESAFSVMYGQRVGGLVVLPDSLFTNRREGIAELALRQRLPSIYGEREYVETGGLMSYGESLREFFRRAATVVDKILKGTKPADLPIEQPTRFFLVINLKTAKAIGLEIPPTLLATADEVIE